MLSYKDVMNNYAQEAYAAYESVSGQTLARNFDGTFKPQGHNDALDAFRHAYTSAAFAQDYGTAASHLVGELNEIKGDYRKTNPQPPKEHNMDDWNNAAGRDIGDNTTTRQEITDAVWDALNNGELITDPNDPRDYRSFDEKLSDWINNFFQDALDWIPRGDPLTLDLDGDGIETIPADGTVLFDHDGDGTKTSTGWIQSDDGIVVMDRNNNGVIDNGRELFGDNTIKADGSIAVDGFDALSDLDSNGDGLVDASDSAFSRLRIWRDFNADGISQSNELFTLDQLGIESIGTAGVAANTNVGNDNIAIAEGTFTYSNGQTGITGVCGFREAA